MLCFLTRNNDYCIPAPRRSRRRKPPSQSAIAHCGGQAGLARLLSCVLGKKVSQQRVWNAVHRDQTVPAGWCLAIEEATGGRVGRHALRPDLYPVKPAGKEAAP
jgi:DNA-binding transcriptional regulator YdaS (Cro superfamily)